MAEEHLETLTYRFSEKIVNAEPLNCDRAVINARYALIDYLSAAFMGAGEDSVDKLLSLIEDEGGSEDVPVIGRKTEASMLQSALVNGYSGHILDFDDVHSDVRGHPSTVIFPTLISLAANYDVSGKRFIAAYIVGLEVMCRLGRAVGKSHYLKGWHNTSTLGTIAAAAAGGYLLKFSVGEMEKVIGFAATQSFGLRIQFGTETKPLHAGLAAQAAVRAVKFVQCGISGTSSVLDGKIGFFSVYGEGCDYAKNILTENWNRSWEIVEPGLWFKKYPCCSASHHAIDAALELFNKYRISTEDIEEVKIIFPPDGDSALIYSKPENCREGMFSAEYVVALALSGQPLSRDKFKSSNIPEDIRKLMAKTRRYHDSSIDIAKDSVPYGRFTIVQLTTEDKRIYEARVDCPRGAPGNGLSLDELKNKLRNSPVSKSAADKIIEVILKLDTGEDLNRLLKLF